ncbi:MAG: hypothetical protein M3Y80_11870, partial [Verrucomicrobiota bacterium]|nr:hypothetical protein [Verrucomicrobiota bacterium]
VSDGALNQYVYATFDQDGGASEAHLSGGDSGGAVFVREGGVWKLAGINYAVDGPFYGDASGANAFNGALFDARDFYYGDGGVFTLIASDRPVSSGFYATRISSKLGWIYSIIDPNGDVNSNGITNLVEYAQSLNSPAPDGPGAPTVVREGNALAFTYRRLAPPNAPQYALQKSNDLRSWTFVSASETIVRVDEDVQTVKALVPMTGSRMFLRVLVSP